MLKNLGRSIAAIVNGALAMLGAASTAGCSDQTAISSGAITEIEPGVEPAWGTLSALTAHPSNPRRLFAVTDQDSPPLRMIEIDVTPTSAKAIRQIAITAPGFDELDVEGLVIKPDGGFWLASEGQAGNSPPNVLLDVDAEGRLLRAVNLPEAIVAKILRQGFEGVARVDTNGEQLYVSFQSGFAGDPEGVTRIGAVNLATGAWTFFYYPLEPLESGDYSGLSDILHLGGRRFALIERDGKGGRHALKWITTIDLGSMAGAPPGGDPPTLTKRRVIDLVPFFLESGLKVEKEIEGLTIAADGQVYAVTDNDNKRPTLLLRLGLAANLFGS